MCVEVSSTPSESRHICHSLAARYLHQYVHDHQVLGHIENATKGQHPTKEEGHMCPACIASTAVVVAGAGSTGGILVVCISKFRKLFRASGLGLFQKMKEK